MFKKQSFFNKSSNNSKINEQDSVCSKFTELTLDEIDGSSIKILLVNFEKTPSKENVKSVSTPFNNKSFQSPIRSVDLSKEIQFTSKKKILFPDSNKLSKKNNLKISNIFSKYIPPSNLESLSNWIKYSSKLYEFNIENVINSFSKKSEIKKLIPNKFCLGNDIVPSYLHKKIKKSKAKKEVKIESSFNVVVKAYKAFKGYIPNETNVTFIGFPKSGKSTILGNILLHLDVLDRAFVKKTEWEAVKMNSVDCKSSWMVDSSNNERYFKETISSSFYYVEINGKSVNLIDSPGNLCYYDQIIKCLIKTDSVMFVINLINDWCPKSEKFNNIEYIYFMFHLFKVFSIDKLEIIFVNCLNIDTINPLIRIQSIWKKFFKSDLICVTVNNLSNIETSEIQLIVDHIYNFQKKLRELELEKPLLLEIIDIFKPIESTLPVVVGCVIRGGISSGLNNSSSKVLISPENITCTVKSMKIHEKNELKTRSFAFPGNIVELTLPEINSEDKIKKGSYICHPECPIMVNQHFQVQMRIFDCDINIPVINGMKIFLWTKSRSCFCELSRILSVEYYENKKTIFKKSPRIIRESGCTVSAQITTEDLLAVEFHSEHKLDVFLLFSELKLFSAGKFIDIVN